MTAQNSDRVLETLYANKVNATFSNHASLFFDGDDPGFSVPHTLGAPEVHTIFAGGLWLGLPTPGGEVDFKLSMSTYGLAFQNFDYGIGPLDAAGNPMEDPTAAIFATIWKVNRLDILLLLDDYNDNQVIDNPIPESILRWPGRGNPFIEGIFGTPLPDQDLASFVDRNNDGIYNPQEGDYPVVDPANPNSIPDEMLWYVFNDQYLHAESLSEPIGVEVQVTAYAFTCQETPVFNTTIFTSHKIINKSGEPLNDLKAGFWYDMDLGCYTDDFIGCDTTLNTFYAYNQDNTDGDNGCSCFGGVNTYCNFPPVQAITLLNQELASLVYYDNPSIGSGSPWPDNAEAFYSFLNGVWPDGTPLTYGGTGYNPGSTDTICCAFIDNPNDPDGWSMNTSGPFVLDRRSILSIPAYSLDNNEAVTIDMAYSFHQDAAEDHLGNVNVMLSEVPIIKDFYEQGFLTSCGQVEFCQEDCVWPGDANHNQLVEKDDYLAIGVAMGNQVSGPQRDVIYSEWFPQTATDWTATFLDGTNHKHGDCNGNGQINFQDRNIVTHNYTLRTPDYLPTDDIEAQLAPNGICIENNKQTVTPDPVSQLLRLLRTTISLGSAANPVEDIYGISFTLVYDSTILEPSTTFPFLTLTNTFFEAGNPIENIYYHEGTNRIDFSFCKVDGQNISNFGNLGQIYFQVREDAYTSNPDGIDTLDFKILNINAIDASENLLDIGYKSDTVVGMELAVVVGTQEVATPLDQIVVFPNPNSGEVHFRLPADELNFPINITLYDLLGHAVLTKQLHQKTDQWSWSLPTSLANGLYYIRLSSENRQSSSRSLLLNR
ncbi:MAG: hypothetical protein DHS20C18_50660 [Saprospiraceae bacterium]|nr:MAG: hypothetical protein DHS20C18_50660 [Saprospiraceae bacterium]